MKKFIIAIIALFVLFCATGCTDDIYGGQAPSQAKQEVHQSFKSRFITVSVGENGDILIDKETRVMYLVIQEKWNSVKSTGITVLLDENGKPLLYEGELD